MVNVPFFETYMLIYIIWLQDIRHISCKLLLKVNRLFRNIWSSLFKPHYANFIRNNFRYYAMTYKNFIFYSCNAKLVLYDINYLIHTFLKYPKFVIFNLSVYEINPFRKFPTEDTGYCRCCGRLISQALMPTHCHVALVDRF